MAQEIAQLAGKPYPHTPISLGALLSQAARKYGDREALACLHQPPDLLPAISLGTGNIPYLKWTYSELYHGAKLLAVALRSRGLRKGDRIAVFSQNGAEWALMFWAGVLLGCPLVLLQPRAATNPQELGHALKLAKAKAVLAWDVELAEQLQISAPKPMRTVPVKLLCVVTGLIHQGWTHIRSLLNQPSSPSTCSLTDLTFEADDPALVLFTSGTTGLPKGCVHTHGTLSCMARNHAEILGLDETAASVSHLSLAHCFGMLYSLSFWAAGAKVVYPNAAFDAVSTLRAIGLESCTHMPAVPSLLYSLAEAEHGLSNATAGVDHVEFSGTNVTANIIELARVRLRAQKVSVHYGMTESGPAVASSDHRVPTGHDNDLMGSGFPVAGCVIRVCAPGSQTPVERGKKGEIHQSSLQLVAGYLGGKNDDTFYSDALGQWYVTGDQGVMLPTGELVVCGRYKDIIVRGGENISPAQMEAVLNCRHGLEVCVVGAPNDIMGEVPVAVVGGAQSGSDQAYIQSLPSLIIEHLGPVFALDQVLSLSDIGLDKFPRTASGKIKKLGIASAVRAFRQKSQQEVQSLVRVDSFRTEDSLQDILLDVWSRVLGVDVNAITPETCIMKMCDSLTLMQMRHVLRRDHGIEMSVPDLLGNATIAEQVEALAKTEGCTRQETYHTSIRDGLPGIYDMIEAYGDGASAQRIQHLAAPCLGLYGLNWTDDAEDVIPMNDILANMVTARRRDRSSMRRDAFYCSSTSFRELAETLQKALTFHPILRSMWIPTSASSVSHLVVKPSERCWKAFMDCSGHTVDTPEDLAKVWYGDLERDLCGSQKGPGPLLRIVLFNIASDPSATGFVYWMNHSAFDATSLSFFHETLEELLDGRTVTPRTSYKPWADSLYAGHRSPSAQAGATYFGQKLKGFAEYEASMVPQQRAPGFLEGDDRGWVDAAGKPGKPGMRVPLDGSLGRSIANEGLIRVCHCPGLEQLQAIHGIAAHTVFKAALALVNMDWTNTKTAFFRSLQSGRRWPFVDSALAAHLPSAADVDGPTLQTSFNVIQLDGGAETSLEFLNRLQADQELATRYECTPLSLALAPFSESDRNALMAMGLSQLFNWVPNRRHMQLTKLKQVQNEMNADTGLHWDFTSLSVCSVEAFVRWDCCHLRRAEVESMLGDLDRAVHWISEPRRWESRLSERPRESSYRVWRPAVDALQKAARSLARSG